MVLYIYSSYGFCKLANFPVHNMRAALSRIAHELDSYPCSSFIVYSGNEITFSHIGEQHV